MFDKTQYVIEMTTGSRLVPFSCMHALRICFLCACYSLNNPRYSIEQKRERKH